MIEYFLLFVSAFASATLLPGSSEVTFLYLLEKQGDVFVLLFFASSGNTLGSVVNWLLGKYFLHHKEKPWFPVKPAQLEKAQVWFSSYGVYSLLLAWLPIFGDAITLAAGMMRIGLMQFLILTLIGKTSRYGVLALLYYGLI